MQRQFKFSDFFLPLTLVFSLASACYANESTSLQPQICHGFNFNKGEEENWGIEKTWLCPKNFAVYSTSANYTPKLPAKYRPIEPNCCPLPSKDILTENHLRSTSRCPEGYVVTGVYEKCEHDVSSGRCQRPFRCTKLNAQRYKLAAATPGVYWGSGSTFWRETSRIMLTEVPAAIRESVGRYNKYSWRTQGCIGFPFGSLLTGKVSKKCRGVGFRQLQYIGIDGDPSLGTPVQMFPSCSTISSSFSTNPECLK